MKRSAPLRRVTGLARSTALRPRSRKTATLYREVRVPLVRRLLAERPACEARLQVCTGAAVDIHEYIPRSKSGAIVPGSKAEAQGQRFISCCRACHRWISDNTGPARRLGLLK